MTKKKAAKKAGSPKSRRRQSVLPGTRAPHIVEIEEQLAIVGSLQDKAKRLKEQITREREILRVKMKKHNLSAYKPEVGAYEAERVAKDELVKVKRRTESQ